jgi:peptidyl-prolyl cis-trans isomerase C
MTLDSTNDKQPETTDATPDTDTQATTDSATPVITDEAATTDASEAAAESHEAVANDEATVAGASAETANEDGEKAAAAEDDADSHHAAASHAATITSAAASPKTSMPTKAIAAVLMLGFVAAAFLFIQRSSSKPVSYDLSKHDMEVIFQEMMQPAEQAQLAASPDDKKKLLDDLRQRLGIAAYAEGEGYGQKPEVQSQIALVTDLLLADAYREKNANAQPTDDEVNAYFQAHPNDFETFLQANPRFQQQAAGPNREGFKKEYGQLKVLAERARNDKLDQDEKVRLGILIQRSNILMNAYKTDLNKNDQLVSDAEIEKYYNDHLSDFESVRARHILISTQPPQPASPDAAKKGEQPKALSDEEARKKAEEVLAKVRKGEDFAALAKQYSDDPGSKDKGGEYTFKPGDFDPDFEKAAFALQPGQISDVVKTRFGYHIIQMEERKSGTGPSDPKVRQQIVAKLKKDKIDAKIDEIVKNSKVTVADDFEMNVKPSEQPVMPPGHPSVQKQ